MNNKIHCADCLEEMKKMEENSIDSIVTDPPYGLSFMGKKWDYDVPSVEIWKECLRVLKPGGYLLSFAGTRTQHRMAVNIEDAGFEIRDMIAWVYSSGFPKSHAIGKAIDKLQGNEREVLGLKQYAGPSGNNRNFGVGNDDESDTKRIDTKGNSPYEGWGTALKPALEPITVARKPFKGTVANNVLKWGTGGINIEKSRVPTQDDEVRKQKILAGEVVCNAFCDKHKSYPSSLSDILSFSLSQLHDFYQHIFSELGSYNISYTNLLHNLGEIDYKNCKQLLDVPYDCGRFEERVNEYVRGNQQFQGSQSDCPTLSRLYGEFVRCQEDVSPNIFPLNSDVQVDILRFLNSLKNNQQNDNNLHLVFVLVLCAYSLLVNNNLHNHYTTCKNKSKGRFPANFCHDGSDEVVDCFPENSQRFFYVPKASKKDRNEGCEGLENRLGGSLEGGNDKRNGKDSPQLKLTKNNHPTVKPTKLMQYLVRLVTPKDGICLDPFMGSGSTGKACVAEGFDFIGIELDEQYCEIAKARIKHAEKLKESKLNI